MEALNHSLNVRIAKKVMFNYKEISTNFSGEVALHTCEVKQQKEMLMAEAAFPNNLNTSPERFWHHSL